MVYMARVINWYLFSSGILMECEMISIALVPLAFCQIDSKKKTDMALVESYKSEKFYVKSFCGTHLSYQ